ncbi:hypothetical protein GCM10022226_74120 [Sphaerisporangium flaviroseum]|uniref:Uncharacterized protein n=1 Tax=Sphaerisporangium flaviroseum TaxID=509199 RepID=A0ABP7JC84_9ACTN
MAPSTWAGVVVFILVIAPGLLFDLLSERRRAGRSESSFREISRVVLASLVFTGLAIMILLAVRVRLPDLLADPERWLREGTPYAMANLHRIMGSLATEMVISLGMVIIVHLVLSWRQGGATIAPVSTWTQVFKRECPKGHEAHVRVSLTSGAVYTGLVAHFSPDLEVADRELVLAPPMGARAGEGPLKPIPPEWERVVLRGSAIERMSVQYRPPQAATPMAAGQPAHEGGTTRPRAERLAGSTTPLKQAAQTSGNVSPEEGA